MGMYDDLHTGVSESVVIMGHKFYAENISPNEAFNRREYEFTPIIGGTERVTKGKYVHREFSFFTTVFFPTGRPNAYDKIFKEMQSKPVTVISKYMGGKFKALIQITPSFPENSPNHMDLDVTVTEVPDATSKIPGEKKLIVPKVKKIKVETNNDKNDNNKSENKASNNNKNKSKRHSVSKRNK